MSEGAIMGLIEKACRASGKEPPKIVSFRRGVAHGECKHERGGHIFLPSRDFAKEYQIASARHYKLLVLHELAHYLVGPRIYHAPKFYLRLFQLCETHNIDLNFALEDEMDYKPRNARKGWEMYLKSQGLQP